MSEWIKKEWIKKEVRGGNGWMVWHPHIGGLLITPKPKDAERIVNALNEAQHIEAPLGSAAATEVEAKWNIALPGYDAGRDGAGRGSK